MIDYLAATIGYLSGRVSFPVGETADKGGVAVTLAGGDVEEHIGGATELRPLLDVTAFADSQSAALRMLLDATAALRTMPPDYEDADHAFRAVQGVTVESLPGAESVSPAGVYEVSATVGVTCEEM